ncbi:bis(5'-nucleosyl)-tetraphosphatase (symmetrical) YqeK [Wukongibacter baidiensis]|uniref:bis(5'-nucleosyl)-tetraphosphatase (symmetrical) YqeK n=1 Tax=Wukongibacter baidiensis TaxID=1723361 RepID=UPI003D7F308B
MYDLEYIKSVLKNKLPHRRYKHSLGVCESATWLARKHDACQSKAEVAGLLHDYAKYLDGYEARKYIKEFHIQIDEVIDLNIDLAHGLIAAELIKSEFKIEDEEILNAVRYHTTGRRGMTSLEKIIYLADYIEPNRRFPGVDEIRNIAKYDLNRAVLMALDNSIKHVISKGLLIHHNSIFARNALITEMASVQSSVEI